MAQREYQLDFSLVRDTERNEHVKKILSEMERAPTEIELEQMGNYILYGKNEKNLSGEDTKDILAPKSRYTQYRTKGQKKTISLDEAMENPLFEEERIKPYNTRNVYKNCRPTIARPTYDDQGNEINAGDGDIPGMRELWAIIDKWKHQLQVALGNEQPYPGEVPKLRDTKNIYMMRHHLVDLQTQQYYLKDMFRPALHFFGMANPERPWVNFASNTGYWVTKDKWCLLARKFGIDYVVDDLAARKLKRIVINKKKIPEKKERDRTINLANEELPAKKCVGNGKVLDLDQISPWDIVRERARKAGEKLVPKTEVKAESTYAPAHQENMVFWQVSENEFDYENIDHIRALIEHYTRLLIKTYDFPYTYSRALCWDLERYVSMAQLSPSRTAMLWWKIARIDYPRMQKKLIDEFGIEYSLGHIQQVCRYEIPKTIATTAKKWRMMCELAAGAIPGKTCAACGEFLPLDPLFFQLNSLNRDGVCKLCCRCEREKRILAGKTIKYGVDIYDRSKQIAKQDRYLKPGEELINPDACEEECDYCNGTKVYQM